MLFIYNTVMYVVRYAMPGRNGGLSCSSPALVAVCLWCSDLFGVYRGWEGVCVCVCVSRVCVCVWVCVGAKF